MLSDALNLAISMSLKLRGGIDFATFDNLMEEDGNVVYKLPCLTSNIKKEVIQVLDFFFPFFKKNEKRKAHSMLSLMLDPRFKTLRFVSSLIVHEKGKAIVEEYDKKSLFSMLSKCYYHLHPLVEFERGVEDKCLDIFEMITNISQPTT